MKRRWVIKPCALFLSFLFFLQMHIPGHAGYSGNEEADRLSREGAVKPLVLQHEEGDDSDYWDLLQDCSVVRWFVCFDTEDCSSLSCVCDKTQRGVWFFFCKMFILICVFALNKVLHFCFSRLVCIIEGDTENIIDRWGGGGDEQEGGMINMKKEKKFEERRERISTVPWKCRTKCESCNIILAMNVLCF